MNLYFCKETAVNREDWESTSHVVKRYVSYKWRIGNFSQYPTETQDKVLSPSFSCSSSTWTLGLEWKNDEDTGNIGLYLQNRSRNDNIKTKFKLCFEDRKGFIHYEREAQRNFGPEKREWGWHCFIKRKMLREHSTFLLPGDILTVYCELSVYENITDGKTEGFQQTVVNEEQDTDTSIVPRGVEVLAKDMEVLWKEKKNCDVNIKVGSKIFTAHKWLLGARSNVFAAMFQHDMEENRTNVVTITDIDSAAVGDMLRYIYTGNVSELTVKKAVGLYYAADKYDLPSLKMQCACFLKRNLSVGSVCDVAEMADEHNDRSLMDSIKIFIHQNTSVLSTKQWKRLSEEKGPLASEIILAVSYKISQKPT